MTVGAKSGEVARLTLVTSEHSGADEQIEVTLSSTQVAAIHSDLSGGASVVTAKPLRSNETLCSVALVRFGEGFVVDPDVATRLERAALHPLLTGRDVNQAPVLKYVIDFFPLAEHEARAFAPAAFQHVVDYVKPGRDQIKDASSRARWWRFGRDKPNLRAMIEASPRYIVTCEVSKHRVFSFVSREVRPDHSLIVVATDDSMFLGVLSGRVHSLWSSAAGSRMGVGNDLRYNRSVCFDPFPFPVCTDAVAARIRALGESLDAHRKRQHALHADLTITGMYNVLEKLRSGEELTAKEKVIHEHGLVSVLKQIHDDLDAAVFDAYGWPHDLTDEQILERLVALNAERAEEERNGLVRWLRPEFQNPAGTKAAKQAEMPGLESDQEPANDDAIAAATWPKKLGEQVAAVRGLVGRSAGEWTAAQGAKAFKGAKGKDVGDVMDALVAVGMLVAWGEGRERKWRGVG